MSAVDTGRLDELRRALLEQRVRMAGSSPAAEPHAVTSRTASGPLPVSASQVHLWRLSQLAPDSSAYNELIEIRKTGAIDAETVQRALSVVVSRHENWRTTFVCVDGVPHQFVSEPTEIDVPLLDLSSLEREEAEQRATAIAVADAARPFDLARGPMVRAQLIRITDEDHRLYLGMHHVIFDGVTLQRVLLPELIAAYRACAAGHALPLPEPAAQYSDYTIWQQDWLSGPTAAARIARCRARLAGVTPTQLPTDHPAPARRRFTGGTIALTIQHATVEALRDAARRVGGTFFHALAAAYAWWLHRYTGSTDVVFATPHDLRQHKRLFTVAGYCATPVVVRCEVTGQETFIELVDRMRRVVTDAISDAVPLATLVAELGVPEALENFQLFQTQLNLEPPMTSPADDWSLHLGEADIANAMGSTKFDINIELDQRTDGHVAGKFFFSTELFDPHTAQDMAAHLERLLEAAAGAPRMPIAQLDVGLRGLTTLPVRGRA
jgi:hypothetical protein